ncbi:hypothetical protein D3C87_1122160 [compost metagenome]
MKLKVTKRIGTHGQGQQVDWSGTEKEFSTIQMHTHGRGWAKLAVLAFLDEQPDFVEVEKCCELDKKYSMVILKSNLESRMVEWTKKPYVRKSDGKAYPNVNTEPGYNIRKLNEVYGMSHTFTDWNEAKWREFYVKCGGGQTHPLTFEQFCQPHFTVLTKELSE